MLAYSFWRPHRYPVHVSFRLLQPRTQHALACRVSYSMQYAVRERWRVHVTGLAQHCAVLFEGRRGYVGNGTLRDAGYGLGAKIRSPSSERAMLGAGADATNGDLDARERRWLASQSASQSIKVRYSCRQPARQADGRTRSSLPPPWKDRGA